MSCGFHHAYCSPCQNSRACRIRRISCRRATIPSSRYCTTSSRSAFTRSGRNSSSRSLFGPSASFASASCALAAGCFPSIPSGARAACAPSEVAVRSEAVAPCADCAPSSGATNPSFAPSLSPFKIARSFKLFVGLVIFFLEWRRLQPVDFRSMPGDRRVIGSARTPGILVFRPENAWRIRETRFLFSYSWRSSRCFIKSAFISRRAPHQNPQAEACAT
jgi:hypothetical protein